MMKTVLAVLALISVALGREGFGPTEQEWGYVDVREGAHLFWWLHQTSAAVASHLERPLVIWLQGGPGSSGTGFGNFAELGPYDADLNLRNTTWLNYANVMFVDNPVGTGWSYVDSSSLLVKTNREIADDFLVFIREFYNTLPEYRNVPLYIFCESYGGKMTAEIGLVLYQAIQAGTLEADFRGVGLGDSWISPIDSVLTWGPYLLNVGAVDQAGYEMIQATAKDCQQAVEAEEWERATDLWGSLEYVVLFETDYIDFYNILTKISVTGFRSHPRLSKPSAAVEDEDAKIDAIMNNQVRTALGLNRSWSTSSGSVFNALYEDFMKPVTSVVESLLNDTTLRVAVYNGQLDLIVDTPGTIDWVDRLQFTQSGQWTSADRSSIVVDNIVEGYVKRAGNLAFYWIDRAGHMVPSDNPAGMWYILNEVTDGFRVD